MDAVTGICYQKHSTCIQDYMYKSISENLKSRTLFCLNTSKAKYLHILFLLHSIGLFNIQHSTFKHSTWLYPRLYVYKSISENLKSRTVFWSKYFKSVVAERSSALDSSSGVARMWVRIPAWPVAALVSLSKTLNHNCFVLRMGRKAVGPVCCVMHVKEPRTPEKGLAPVFLDSHLEHPAGWICARYKSYHY